LQGLGLGKYAGAFEDHEIDLDALPHLTEPMLVQLGLPIGPRAKVLAAVARLATQPAPDAASLKEAPVAEPAPPAPPRHAERRQMTVMFCDLVDSTRLASALDPEDFTALMQAYQTACATVIARYEGHVSQYRGDAIEAYFGWPAAQEDAAERCVRAALEIVAEVAKVRSHEPLAVRVGVSTGVVVIGESGRDGDPTAPSGAVGDTPHIAARLEALAAPNTVVISEATSRLISARFDQEALGPKHLKGIAEPVAAFRVHGVREDSSRFQAAHAAALTPLVGRRTELALLQHRWRDAKEGEGQAVYIAGVPGIGKSRIVHELEQWIGGDPYFSLRFQCLPHHTQSAHFPVIQQLRRLARIAPEDPAPVRLRKLERLLARAADPLDQALPFVAELLSIETGVRQPFAGLNSLQVKVRTQYALADLLLGLAARRPVLCLVEDAQWIDPSTRELIEAVVDRIGKARILLVVTHRPETQLRTSAHGNVSALTLSRLGKSDVSEMARLALRERPVPGALLERIIEESDSIPLFVEELARGVLESGSSAVHQAGAAMAASWSVPASLRDSLMARLDRAPQARSVAQTAAVVGREFSYDILLRISGLADADLDASLEHLQRSEIVQRIDAGPSPRYAFKHALLRDAAYESLLRSNRRAIHASVAAAIERDRPDVVAGHPELLAYHYGLAGNAATAIRYWLLGGQRARNRSANAEAVGQFRHALELLDSLPDSPERGRTELEAQLALGLCFIALHGYAADDTRRAFERACVLSAELGESRKEVQALFGLWGHNWMRAQHDRAIELAETLLQRAELLRDPTALVVGHRAIGSTLFTLGDFVPARAHLERSIAVVPQASSRDLALAYAVDPRIAAQLVLAWDLWVLGYPRSALEQVLQAFDQAMRLADPYTLAFAHYIASAVRLLRGEAQDALAHADRSLALSTEYGINLYALYSRFGRGCALALLRQPDLALTEIRAGIEQADRSNLGYLRGFMLGWLATVQAEVGDAVTALATVDDALRRIDAASGRAWEAELHRLRGDLLLAGRAEAFDEAEASYRNAIALARRQSAHALELRAATAAARLLHRRGRDAEASALLNPVYEWFTEGHDTADLQAASAALDALQHPSARRVAPA
jgi:class 3 adenylate cyclase/predicted ATPase